MAVLKVTTREFRARQAFVLSRADAGEVVIIRRGRDKSYMLTPIHDRDVVVSEEFRKKVEKAREDFKNHRGVTCETFEDSIALFEKL